MGDFFNFGEIDLIEYKLGCQVGNQYIRNIPSPILMCALQTDLFVTPQFKMQLTMQNHWCS